MSGGRLLLVTYEFPPLGGVGVQRSLKFAKYLPSHGWTVDVLTVADPPGALQDPSLLAELPADVAIHRVWSLEPARAVQWVRRRRSRTRSSTATSAMAGSASSSINPVLVRSVQALFVPDEKRLWRAPARRQAMRVLEKDPCDVIMSSGPPHTAHLVAGDVAAATGAPWIVDLRDPWIGNYFFRAATPLHARLQASWERRVVSTARLVLTVSEPMADQLRARHPDLPRDRFVVLPNGFDPADMPSPRSDGRGGPPLSVAYVGMFQGSITPDVFFAGAALAIQSGRIPPDALVFRHIGRGGDVVEAAASRGIGHVAHALGFLPHKEALAAAQESHTLLLVIPAGTIGAPILTGKLFEYLGLGLPILALAPEGPASDLIRRASAGIVVDPQDAGGVADALTRLYGMVCSGSTWKPDKAVVDQFDRRVQAAVLAQLLTRAATGYPRAGGRA